MAYGTISPNAEDYEAEWRTQADSSLLRRAVENWMPDGSYWFDNAFARLPETIRVNPLRIDSEAVEDWTKSIGKCLPKFNDSRIRKVLFKHR